MKFLMIIQMKAIKMKEKCKILGNKKPCNNKMKIFMVKILFQY